MRLNPRDEKTRLQMAGKFPIGSAVTVDGKPGKVDGYALHSKQYFVTVGGDRQKLPANKIKPA